MSNSQINPYRQIPASCLYPQKSKSLYLRTSLFILLIGFFNAVSAQEIRINGDVINAMTLEGINRATVSLMTTDSSTVLATDTTRYRIVTEKGDNWENNYVDKYSGATFSFVTPTRKAFMLLVQANGFENYYCKVEPDAGSTVVQVPTIYLIPQAKKRKLNEVVVKATRIKMYYKGDTLVYNADAFNMAQTESLRKLVQQLPGAEMTDGEIRINGKRVDNLLISGKDFFQGNIEAALDNLPAYIVSRIKVYDKAGEQSELTGQDMHDESYVMDVHLKRKYIGTWMAKLSADAGTGKLWGGQAFLMRFDDRQMFSVNADVNNFNKSRQIMDIGNTEEVDPAGHISTKTARFSYYIEPDKTWRFTSSGSVSRKDTDKESWQNNETYLLPDNLMSRSSEHLDGEDVTAMASAGLRFRKLERWQHSWNYNFNYERSRSTRDSRSLSYYLPAKAAWEGLSLDSIIRLEEKEADENALLYSLLDPELSRSHRITHRPEWHATFVFGADLLNFNALLKHETQTRRNYSNYRLTTYADGTTDTRRRYLYRRDYLLDLNPELEWVHHYERLKRYNGVVKPFLRYSHRYGTANHPEYRLERMTEWSEQQGWGLESLGRLPETEWQALCLDAANSYYSTEREEKAEAGVRLSHKVFFERGTSLQIEANESFYYQHRSLDYDREGYSYNPQRKGFFFHPDLTLTWKHESREGRIWMPEWNAGYQGMPAMPELTQLLPIRDASDPLNRFVGNADLGNSFTHRLSSAYRLQHVKSGRSFHIDATYRRLHNDIATQSVYDPATGIRTYQPVNTSRTHAVQGRTEFSTPLDSKKRLYLSASFAADYYQAENLSFLAEESVTAAGLLRNIGLTPQLTLRATAGRNFRFYGYWKTAFRRVSQPGMTDNYRETNLYGDINYTLPWNIQLATLIRTTLYAGNSQAELNRTVTNWDVSLSKYFFDDRLGIHFTAHDLLAQASTYRSEVTTTGRIEQYTDVLPRYVMLTVSYNFDWVGKKQ